MFQMGRAGRKLCPIIGLGTVFAESENQIANSQYILSIMS